MLFEKFTATYHIPQKAIHYSELNIIISTITQFNFMLFVATTEPFTTTSSAFLLV